MAQQDIRPVQIDATGLADGVYAFAVVGGVITGFSPATAGGTDIPVVSVLPDPSESELNDLVVWVP